jgi:hypothetical protein
LTLEHAFGRRFRVERVERRKFGQFFYVEVLDGIFSVVGA